MIAVSLLTLQRPPLSHYPMPYLPTTRTGSKLSLLIRGSLAAASIIRSSKQTK